MIDDYGGFEQGLETDQPPPAPGAFPEITNIKAPPVIPEGEFYPAEGITPGEVVEFLVKVTEPSGISNLSDVDLDLSALNGPLLPMIMVRRSETGFSIGSLRPAVYTQEITIDHDGSATWYNSEDTESLYIARYRIPLETKASEYNIPVTAVNNKGLRGSYPFRLSIGSIAQFASDYNRAPFSIVRNFIITPAEINPIHVSPDDQIILAAAIYNVNGLNDFRQVSIDLTPLGKEVQPMTNNPQLKSILREYLPRDELVLVYATPILNLDPAVEARNYPLDINAKNAIEIQISDKLNLHLKKDD